MKRGLIITLILQISIFTLGYGQFSFGVSPGIGLNSSYFGYKVNNKFVPYVGLQYLNVSFKYEESGQKYDYDLNNIASYTDNEEFSGSLYIPNIGVKYFVKQQNKIQAYLSLNVSTPFVSGKLNSNGTEDTDFKDEIKNISMWGGEFGFGMEYFLDDNFSLGGEFGLRHIHFKYSDSRERSIYNPNTGTTEPVTIEDSYKLNTSPTFSKISLNYYF